VFNKFSTPKLYAPRGSLLLPASHNVAGLQGPLSQEKTEAIKDAGKRASPLV